MAAIWGGASRPEPSPDVLPLNHLVDQADDLARFNVALQRQLGVDELSVDRNFKTPAVGWYERNAFDRVLELLE